MRMYLRKMRGQFGISLLLLYAPSYCRDRLFDVSIDFMWWYLKIEVGKRKRKNGDWDGKM